MSSTVGLGKMGRGKGGKEGKGWRPLEEEGTKGRGSYRDDQVGGRSHGK